MRRLGGRKGRRASSRRGEKKAIFNLPEGHPRRPAPWATHWVRWGISKASISVRVAARSVFPPLLKPLRSGLWLFGAYRQRHPHGEAVVGTSRRPG